jgi:hypothetical protein
MNVASSSNFGEFDACLARVPPKAHKKLKQVINFFIVAMLDLNHLRIITLGRHKILIFKSSTSPLSLCSHLKTLDNIK